MTALRLIIENHPSWQKPATQNYTTTTINLPAPSQTIYSILGRRGTLWHTIAPRIDHANDALSSMDVANRSQLFDRLVIVTATSLSGQAAGRWDTFACAVPFNALAPLPERTFEELLSRMERWQATHPTSVSESIATPIVPAKKDASLLLVMLTGIALWSEAWPVMIGVAVLCLLETLYQAGSFDGFIPLSQRQFVQTGRFYLYALCGGLIAIPLMAGTMLRIASFFGI